MVTVSAVVIVAVSYIHAFAGTPALLAQNSPSEWIVGALATACWTLYVYFSAANRDRHIKFADMLFGRLDEIPKTVVAYVQASNRADTREKLLEELRIIIAKESNEDAKKCLRQQEQNYMVDFYDALSECNNAASRIKLLIAMCPYPDKLNKDLADSVINSMNGDKRNPGAATECAAEFVKAEAKSIRSEALDNSVSQTLFAAVRSIFKPPAVSDEVSGKAAGQADRPDGAR
jgi:hypothetical protein